MRNVLKKTKESRTGEEGCCDAAEQAGRKVRELVDRADTQWHEVADKAADEIRNKPLQSGAIAVAAGLILGLLLRRR